MGREHRRWSDALSGGFEFVFGGPVGTAGLCMERVVPELERERNVWGG